MVQFETKMAAWAIRRWLKYYINYGELKAILTDESTAPLISLWKFWGPFGRGGFTNSDSIDKKTEGSHGESSSGVSPLESDGGKMMQSSLLDSVDYENEEDEFGRRDSVEYEAIRQEIKSMFYVEGDENKYYHKSVQSGIARNFRFRKELQKELLKAHDFFNKTYDRLKAEFDLLHNQGMKVVDHDAPSSQRNSSLMFRDSNFGVEIGSSHSINSNPLTSEVNHRGNVLPSISDTTIDTELDQSSSISNGKGKIKKLKRNENEIKSSEMALVDLHLRICQLETFAIINHTCIMKIMKKHDKVLITKNTYHDAKGGGFAGGIDKDDSSATLLNTFNILPLSTPTTFEKMEKNLSFVKPYNLFELKNENEVLFAKLFCDNSLELAKAELFMKRKAHGGSGGGLSYSFPFRFGCRVGALIILVVWVIWDIVLDFAILRPSEQREEFDKCHSQNGFDGSSSIIDVWFSKDFPVYRGLISLALALWLWGGLLRLWNILRINYLFMLELNPSITPSSSETLWTAADISIVVLWSFNIHFKVLRCDFVKWPSHGSLGIWPLIPIAFISYKALFPWRERQQMWSSIRDVVIAPFVSVTFNMNYVGDVLTSMVKPLVDISYMVCFYTSGDWLQSLGESGYCTRPDTFYTSVVTPIILLGPYWLRFMQCLRRYRDGGKRHPNLPNALKYALSMLVTLAGIFNPTFQRRGDTWSSFQIFWTISYFASTIYSWLWDVLMDWSLLEVGSPGLLRRRRMIKHPGFYYAAVVIDLVLRFFWTWTLIPNGQESDFSNLSQYVAPFAAFAEIFRRSMWSIFRLENEHLNNTAGYRKVTHIPFHYELALNQQTNQDGEEGQEAEDPNKQRQIWMEISIFVVCVLALVTVAVVSDAS